MKNCVEGIVIEVRARQSASRLVYTMRLLPKDPNKPIMNIQVRPSAPFYAVVKKIYDEMRQPLIEVCFDEANIPIYIEEKESDVSDKLLEVFRKRGMIYEAAIHPIYGAIAITPMGRVILSSDTASLTYRKIEACGGRAEAYVFVYPVDNLAVGAIIQRCIEENNVENVDARQLIAEVLEGKETKTETEEREDSAITKNVKVEESAEPPSDVSDEEIEKAVEELEKELQQQGVGVEP